MAWIIGAVGLTVVLVFAIALFTLRRQRSQAAIQQQTAKLKERVEHVIELADSWLSISDLTGISTELLRLGQESLDSVLVLAPRNRYALQRQEQLSAMLAAIDDDSDRERTTVLDSPANLAKLTQQLKAIKRTLRIRLHAGFLTADDYDRYSAAIDELQMRCSLDTLIHFGRRSMEAGNRHNARKSLQQALEIIRKSRVLDATVEAYFKEVSALNQQLGDPEPPARDDGQNPQRYIDPT